MEQKFRTLSIDEIKEKLTIEDLQMRLTLGITVSGTYQDLQSLVSFIESDQRFERIYKSISAAHLRIVKRDEWDAFIEWKEKKNDPR